MQHVQLPLRHRSPCLRLDLLINDPTLQAVHNGTLDVCNSDFNGTFIRLRGMARSFAAATVGVDQRIPSW